jgi:hypothetical protein
LRARADYVCRVGTNSGRTVSGCLAAALVVDYLRLPSTRLLREVIQSLQFFLEVIMDDVIFRGYGVEIFKRVSQYFIRYDAGEIVVQMEERPISEADAFKAQLSERDAYEVILASQRKG